MNTLEQVQQLWRERWVEKPVERPSCYNRPAFNPVTASREFPARSWYTAWIEGCPHWKPGGNAYVRPWCDSAGGMRTPWTACHGCEWKGEE